MLHSHFAQSLRFVQMCKFRGENSRTFSRHVEYETKTDIRQLLKGLQYIYVNFYKIRQEDSQSKIQINRNVASRRQTVVPGKRQDPCTV
jgi:hypothetical protein